jgi:hypothetical protein
VFLFLFLQTFRILDAKDGKVDGVLSLAKREIIPTAGGPESAVKQQAISALS